MKKHFYTHLIEIDSLFISLDLLDMKHHQRQELVSLVETNVHHVVLDTVMSHLTPEDKKEFLKHVHADNHDEVWNLLHGKTKHMDKKIKTAVEKLKLSLHKDIAHAKKKQAK